VVVVVVVKKKNKLISIANNCQLHTSRFWKNIRKHLNVFQSMEKQTVNTDQSSWWEKGE
jgi:hypothetical protein